MQSLTFHYALAPNIEIRFKEHWELIHLSNLDIARDL